MKKNKWLSLFLLITTVVISSLSHGYAQTLDEDSWEELKEEMVFEEDELETRDQNTSSTNPFLGPAIITLLRIGGIILLSSLLIFLIVTLISRSKSTKKIRVKKSGSDEELEELTVHSPIEVLWDEYEAAKQSGNYREALRMLYKITLKGLDSKGIIRAEIDKTNSDYVREFPQGDLKSIFTDLSLIHEISWYGENHLNEGQFEKFAPLFINFIESTKGAE